MSILLDTKQCYQAIKARDKRFDGRFFFGVESTGVYCRPICSARSPKFENCCFFSNAAIAETAGFRPCLRCRPELAPENASVNSQTRLVKKAISLIENDFFNEGHLSDLAKKLNVTDRHLRRSFKTQLGVNPINFLQTQHLLLAKRLLTDTSLPITEIAFAAGFNSLRRFNALFKDRYGVPPTSSRRKIDLPAQNYPLVFELTYIPPLDWNLTLKYLNEHSISQVEYIDLENGIYRRTVQLYLNKKWYRGWVKVENLPNVSLLKVSLDSKLAPIILPVLGRIKNLFDLSCQPDKISPVLGLISKSYPGIRVPGAFDGFEIAVFAFLRQTSEKDKNFIGLTERFIQYFGEKCSPPFLNLDYFFPTPERIANASLPELCNLGVKTDLAKIIIRLAQNIIDKKLSLSPNGEVGVVLEWICHHSLIKEETQQYILMRALCWPDAFPLSYDSTKKLLKARSLNEFQKIIKFWSPWRAYAAMCLWAKNREKQS